MQTLQFKTTIKCASCIATVSPELNNKDNIQDWSVDLTNPDRILTINTTSTAEEIKELLGKVGYKAELIKA